MNRVMALFALMAVGAGAGTNLFVGKWHYNEQKSPKPTITYSVVSVGGGAYDVTGSGGHPLRIKADGVMIDSPFGGKVSFKKLSERKWEMVRHGQDELLRTYTVSEDDKSLELDDVYTLANGEKQTTGTTYSRTSPGKGIVGSWRSVSMDVNDPKSGWEMDLQASGSDILTVNSPANKRPYTFRLDGKPHLDTEQDPDAQKGMTTTATLVDAHTVRTVTKVNGKLESTGELTISGDGKTLTEEDKSVVSGAVFVSVFDRK